MERIFVNGQTYLGDCIFKNQEFSIYVIDYIRDKYLFLHHKDHTVQDMIVTGLDKIYNVIRLIEENTDREILKKQIYKNVRNIKQQSYNKSLKMIDKLKLRQNLISFYDNNYPLFVFLGVKLNDFLQLEMNS